MKKAVLVLAIILFVCLCLGFAVYYTLFLPNNEVVPAFDEGKLNLVVEGDYITDGNPKIVNEEIMLPFDIVKKYFDPNINWDSKLKKVTVTTKDRVIRMKTDSLNALVNNKPIDLKIPVVEEQNVVFIPIEFLSDFYNIEINHIKDNNVVIIDRKNSVREIAEPINAEAVIRRGRTIHYPVVKTLNSDQADENKMRIFEEYEKWYKVRATDGTLGFIEKRFVKVTKLVVEKTPEDQEKNPPWKPDKGKINLVWDAVYDKKTSPIKESKIEGLDVISPTWFQVADKGGTLINRASLSYVDWAHKNGYKVWALLSNDSTEIDDTSDFLNNTDSRDYLIKQVLAFASLYKLDGINIDFENVYKKDKDALTQFIRELTPLLREQGLLVSIDVTVPDGSDNWSLCYDRKALGEVVDYMMLMTYDQYWASSPEAGSVAQVTWVEKNVKKVIEMVPREKLLLGLPFYVRVWKNETGKKMTSSAVSMGTAKKLIKENNAQVKWDDESGQFYAAYTKDGANYRLWLEDENSINLKSSLMHKYRLAGTAAWKKDLELPEVWNVLDNNTKVVDHYQEWLDQNKTKTYVYKD